MKSALILCGGMGERLKDLTKYKPKVLLEVDGEPILSHIIRECKKVGIRKYYIDTHWKYGGRKIEEYLNDKKENCIFLSNKFFPKKYSISYVVKYFSKFERNSLLVLKGDTLLRESALRKIIKFHKIHKDGDASVLLVPYEDGKKVKYDEKNKLIIDIFPREDVPKFKKLVYIFRTSSLKDIEVELFEKEKGNTALSYLLSQIIKKNGKVYGLVEGEDFVDVDYLKDLKKAQNFFRNI